MVDSMTTKIILGFVTLLVGIVLIGSVSTETVNKTKLSSVTNESIDVSSVRCDGSAGQCGAAGTSQLGNDTNASVVLSFKTNLGDTNLDCGLSSVTLKNSTNATVAATGYNITYSTLGVVNLQFINGSGASAIQDGAHSNVTWIDYSYCPNGYLTETWSRSVTNTVPGFFAIALMLVAVGLFYGAYADFRKK
jgi:hypothetical protein